MLLQAETVSDDLDDQNKEGGYSSDLYPDLADEPGEEDPLMPRDEEEGAGPSAPDAPSTSASEESSPNKLYPTAPADDLTSDDTASARSTEV